ncbi:MAG: hypothetical protein ABW220_17600 [Burkholderiaceae bacterium]
MRIFITKTETDLQALSATLSRKASGADATFERVAALNPQLANAKKLAAGTVVLLPDSAELKAGVGTAVGMDNLSDLVGEVTKGVKAASGRATSRFESIAADHSAVKDVLKTAAAKKLVESDPLLKQKLAAAETRFKADQKKATETKARFEETQKFAVAEFEKLAKLLGQ